MSAAGTLIAIGCGLGAALCFGTGDFLAQRLTHRHGAIPTMFAVQVMSLAVLALLAIAWHGAPSLALAGHVDVVAIGLVNTLGMIGLYRAFETGKLSLTSPIAGSMGAFTVGFAYLAGQPPPAIVIPALLAVVLGIIVASVVDEPSTGQLVHVHRARGVGWALLSAISFGWVFFVLGPCSVTLGPAWTLAIMRAVAIVLLLALARPMRSRLTAALRSKPEQSSSHVRTLVVACLDSTGMVLFTFGTSHEAIAGEIAVVAVLTSSFPLVALALARVYLRERLRWWQWLGVAAVVVGVVWISATY